jgi:hypothetical protein
LWPWWKSLDEFVSLPWESASGWDQMRRDQFLSFFSIWQKKEPCDCQSDHTAYRDSEDDILIDLVEFHERPFKNLTEDSSWILVCILFTFLLSNCDTVFGEIFMSKKLPIWTITYEWFSDEWTWWSAILLVFLWSRRCHRVNYCSHLLSAQVKS